MQDARYEAPGAEIERGESGPGDAMPFAGFDVPESNFWRLPNNWFDLAARFTSWAEQKVVEYILRHTWGFHEYGMAKLITMDEFMHGRKRRDGTRMDAGCGMAENSIKKGIQDAVTHGFLVVETDDSDKGRIKKYYAPRMRRLPSDEGLHGAVRPQDQSLRLEGQSLIPAPQPLTPEDRGLSLETRRVIPSSHLPDPRTEHTTGEIHPDQETSGNTTGRVVAFSSNHTQTHSRGLRAISALPQPADPHQEARDYSRGNTAPHKGQRDYTPGQSASPAIGSPATTGRAPAPGEMPRQLSPVDSIPASSVEATPDGRSLVDRLVAEGVAASRARQLVADVPTERVERQLAWIGRRSCRDRAATLVRAIVDDFSEPLRASAQTGVLSFDRAKFFRGAYAVCPHCGRRPCAADCPTQTE